MFGAVPCPHVAAGEPMEATLSGTYVELAKDVLGAPFTEVCAECREELRRSSWRLSSRTSGLLPDEWKVLDALAAAQVAHVALPVQRECDVEDFTAGVHVLQRIVMARLARRAHPPGVDPDKHGFTLDGGLEVAP